MSEEPYVYKSVQVEPEWIRRLNGEIIDETATPLTTSFSNRGGRPVLDVETRWARKTKINRKTGCIEWKGKLNANGKSTFYADGKPYDHQEYAWLREHGVLPATSLKTTCGTIGCVNVDHLEPKPQRRARIAQQALTTEGVLYIRAEYDKGRSPIAIAKEFEKISEQTVVKVARRKSYLWVPEHRKGNDA